MEQDGKTIPDWLDVSRETLQRLEAFVALVEKWNPAINLVSRRSLSEIWDRHLLDSAQLFPMIPPGATHLVDLGSGGGFPGAILAILTLDAMPELHVTMVEADQRKATFLSEAVRKLELRGTVVAQRIEALPPQRADVLTARALAPLSTLCGHAERHLDRTGVALFSKGIHVEDEIADARRIWAFSETRIPSKSDRQATILTIRDLRHV